MKALGCDPCCGLDVHKNKLVAAFRDGIKVAVKEYGATTTEVQRLAGDMKKAGSQMVTMESTVPHLDSGLEHPRGAEEQEFRGCS